MDLLSIVQVANLQAEFAGRFADVDVPAGLVLERHAWDGDARAVLELHVALVDRDDEVAYAAHVADHAVLAGRIDPRPEVLVVDVGAAPLHGVVVVAVEDPESDFWGSTVAAPVFARIAEAAICELGLAPQAVDAAVGGAT